MHWDINVVCVESSLHVQLPASWGRSTYRYGSTRLFVPPPSAGEQRRVYGRKALVNPRYPHAPVGCTQEEGLRGTSNVAVADRQGARAARRSSVRVVECDGTQLCGGVPRH